MARTSLDERIERLEQQLKEAKARKKMIEARRRAIEARKNRRADTRRKILVGALILAKVERGEYPQEQLLAMLDQALTRPDDRALFELPPRKEANTPTNTLSTPRGT